MGLQSWSLDSSILHQYFRPDLLIIGKNPTDLFESLGPWLLGSNEARLHVLGLLEASKELLVEGVLLPGPDPVSIFRHQGATDGGV